jgi:RimJ/RimL family protein N-acetyltransferase
MSSIMLLPVLETERLTIRPLVMSDLAPCHQLYVEIRWGDSALSVEANRERRRSWLEWTIRNYEELARLLQPPYGDRAVTLKDSRRLIGLVGLVPLLAPFAQLRCFGNIERARFTTEMGLFWAMFPAMQGQGFATEAARALIDYAFETLHVGRIMAGTEYDNLASIGVMRRLGMRIERNPFAEPAWFQITGILENDHANS